MYAQHAAHPFQQTPPLLGQYLVCSINCHRAHVSTHTHKNTLFLNSFTVAYYSQTSLHQSNSRMINIGQQLFVFYRSFVEKSKKGHKSTVNK